MSASGWSSATAILRLATELVDGIQLGVVSAGFADVRPMHGFAFARLSESAATTAQLAQHLGVTKQATSEIVSYLLERGYLTKQPDPRDGRANLLVLTPRGVACTAAAQRAAADVVARWESRIAPDRLAEFHGVLASVPVPGRLRPAW